MSGSEDRLRKWVAEWFVSARGKGWEKLQRHDNNCKRRLMCGQPSDDES